MSPAALRALRGADGQMAIDRAIRGARANQNLDQVNELVRLKAADLDNPPAISAAALDRVRIAMGERGKVAARNGSHDVAAGLFARKTAIDSALDATPGLKEARTAYRQRQAQREAVDIGARAYSTPSADYSAALSRLATLTPNARKSAAVGHRESLVNAIERSPEGATGAANRIATSSQQGGNLAATFGETQAQRYQDSMRLETQRLRNANFVSPNTGSQTALRTADESLLASIPLSRHQLIGAVLSKLRSGLTMTAAERAEIVRLGISDVRLRSLAKTLPSSRIEALRRGITYVQLSQSKRAASMPAHTSSYAEKLLGTAWPPRSVAASSGALLARQVNK